MTVPGDVYDALRTLGSGGEVAPVFGAHRAEWRDALAVVLRGIEPNDTDRMDAALGFGSPRRVAAYDAGVRHLKDVYNTVLAQ